ADFQLDFFFVLEHGGQDLYDLLTNGVAVVDEFHFVAGHQHIGNLVRESDNFFTAQSHHALTVPFPANPFFVANPIATETGKSTLIARNSRETCPRVSNTGFRLPFLTVKPAFGPSPSEIERASCRERVSKTDQESALKKKIERKEDR